MGKISILVAIMTFCISALPAFAEDYRQVRMRSDGRLIDGEGNIIAIPAIDDKRNTEHKFYYKALGPDGKPQRTADSYIMNDPKSGIIRYPVNPRESAGDIGPKEEVSPDGMVRKYSGSQTLEKTPNAPIYNERNNEVRTLY